MLKYFANTSNVGKLMILIGILIAFPIVLLPFYPKEIGYLPSFLFPALISILLGLWICRKHHQEAPFSGWKTNIQSGSLTVLFAWFYGFVMGALPFVLAGLLNPLQAFFEAVSGWTTTGLSVMDVTVTPKIFLFHRSFMQFCGGLGFVMVMLLFIHNKQSMNLYNAEGHPDKLMPNLKRTTQTIFVLYNTFVIIGTIFYCLFGMDAFDALCHAMCALSTGGFSTQLNSLGEYNNLSFEIITIALMLIGTTNFAVLLLLAKRKWKQFLKVSEIRFLLVLLLLVVPLIAFSLSQAMNVNIFEALRQSLFNSVSALSTTGYATLAFQEWPQFALGLLILLMLIGGGIGSTAGGIKLSRVYLLCRIALLNLKKRVHPTRRIEVPYYTKAQGKTTIDNSTIADTTGFFLFYIFIFMIGVLLLTITSGFSLIESAFEFASALGTVGLSIGITAANSNPFTLITLICGMILGRLEIFIVFIGLYFGWKSLRERFLKF